MSGSVPSRCCVHDCVVCSIQAPRPSGIDTGWGFLSLTSPYPPSLLYSNYTHAQIHTYNECLLCAWHFLGHEVSDEQDEQRLCHTETHVLGENPGEETSEFSCLLCHVFQTSAHAISSGRPSPITHSTIATHLPSFSIPLIYFSL